MVNKNFQYLAINNNELAKWDVTCNAVYVISFRSNKAHDMAALISVSLVLPRQTTDTGLVMYHAVCLFTSQLSPVLIAPTQKRRPG